MAPVIGWGILISEPTQKLQRHLLEALKNPEFFDLYKTYHTYREKASELKIFMGAVKLVGAVWLLLSTYCNHSPISVSPVDTETAIDQHLKMVLLPTMIFPCAEQNDAN